MPGPVAQSMGLKPCLSDPLAPSCLSLDSGGRSLPRNLFLEADSLSNLVLIHGAARTLLHAAHPWGHPTFPELDLRVSTMPSLVGYRVCEVQLKGVATCVLTVRKKLLRKTVFPSCCLAILQYDNPAHIRSLNIR